MASRGSYLKQDIVNKILKIFPDSFLYNDGKEIRINGKENGEMLQIKVTLTCAKTAVENPSISFNNSSIQESETITENIPDNITEPTEEEKERLKILLEKLGM